MKILFLLLFKNFMMFWDRTSLCSLICFYTHNHPLAQVLKLLVFTSILNFCFSLKRKLSYQYLFFPNTIEITRKNVGWRNTYFKCLEKVRVKILYMLWNWTFALGHEWYLCNIFWTALRFLSTTHWELRALLG